MRGIKPNKKMWDRVNQAIKDENAGVAFVTIISGLCHMLMHLGVVKDEDQARIHLAAMIISPDDRPIRTLLPKLQAELARLDDGKWMS
jgi:hypothetical protein